MEASPSTEILIVKNPIFYKASDPEAFEILIKDGAWLPIVFATLKSVVENHFYELCDLNWDYLIDEKKAPETHVGYKSIFHHGLNEEQRRFAESVADEIESLLAENIRQTLEYRAQEGEGDDE